MDRASDIISPLLEAGFARLTQKASELFEG